MNTIMGKLAEKNDAFKVGMIAMKEKNKAMVMVLKKETKATIRTLSTRIKELKRELIMCRVTMGKEVLSATLNQGVDVPKTKHFKEERSTREVDNFLWKMKQYFCAIGIKDDDVKVNTTTR